MKKQMNLSGLRDELAQVQTKKKEFLETMDRIIPSGQQHLLFEADLISCQL